jgi:hypothetical protein
VASCHRTNDHGFEPNNTALLVLETRGYTGEDLVLCSLGNAPTHFPWIWWLFFPNGQSDFITCMVWETSLFHITIVPSFKVGVSCNRLQAERVGIDELQILCKIGIDVANCTAHGCSEAGVTIVISLDRQQRANRTIINESFWAPVPFGYSPARVSLLGVLISQKSWHT